MLFNTSVHFPHTLVNMDPHPSRGSREHQQKERFHGAAVQSDKSPSHQHVTSHQENVLS